METVQDVIEECKWDTQGTMDDPQEDRIGRKLAADAKQQEDFDDFNRELAGVQSAKMYRFLRPDQRPEAVKIRQDSVNRWRHIVSAALKSELERFSQELAELDRASLQAYSSAERSTLEAQERLESIRERASRNQTGQRVYLTRDGARAFQDDGRELTSPQRERVRWQQGAPTWEQRQQAGDALSRAAEDLRLIGEHRALLTETRTRIESGDEISDDELAVLEKSVKNAPDAVRRQLEGSRGVTMSAARQYVDDGTAPAAMATSASFNRAGAATPEPASPSVAPRPVTPAVTSALGAAPPG